MPDAETSYLRIHCLCGQKMKVSDSMYGLPGKCVACRQKIRIPRPDEAPEGVVNIYLKDHPELLRERRRVSADRSKPPVSDSPVSLGAKGGAQEAKEVVLGEVGDPAENLPLEAFGYLQELCSLEYRLAKNLAAEGVANPAAPPDDAPPRLGEMAAEWQRVEDLRADLNEDLRQRLLETAIELASTQEKIGEAALDARVGKLAYAAYAERVGRLRERRERLERQQQNLRGWLRLRDPYLAGGYVDVPAANLERLAHGAPIPLATEETPSALDAAVERLRLGLEQREEAERRLRETRAAHAKGELSDRRARIARRTDEARKVLAEAAVGFYRTRLGQLRTEFRRDLEIIERQKEQLHQSAKALGRGDSDSRERGLLRAKADCAKAIDLIERALTANTAHEAPHLRGTFLARLGGGGVQGIGQDAWAAWGAALALLAGVFLPLAPGVGLLTAYSGGGGAQWALLAVVATAVAAGLAAGIPLPRVRAWALLVVWAASTAAGVWMLREAWYTPSLFAASVRTAGALWARPAMLALVLGNLALLAAGVLAASREKQLRWAPLAVALAVLVIAAFVVTNAAGTLNPVPVIEVSPGSEPPRADASADHLLYVANAGRRPFYLLTAPAAEAVGMKNAYMLALQQREGLDGWRDATAALDASFTRAASLNGPTGMLQSAPGERLALAFRAGAGDYRLLLQNQGVRQEFIQTFTTAAPLSPPPPEPAPSDETDPPDEAVEETPDATPEPEPLPPLPLRPGHVPVEIELRGAATVGDHEPVFSFVVHYPGGERVSYQLNLGDEVHEGWIVREYNPQRQMAVLSSGTSIVTISRGERVALP